MGGKNCKSKNCGGNFSLKILIRNDGRIKDSIHDEKRWWPAIVHTSVDTIHVVHRGASVPTVCITHALHMLLFMLIELKISFSFAIFVFSLWSLPVRWWWWRKWFFFSLLTCDFVRFCVQLFAPHRDDNKIANKFSTELWQNTSDNNGRQSRKETVYADLFVRLIWN